jgi:hypothetical protein
VSDFNVNLIIKSKKEVWRSVQSNHADSKSCNGSREVSMGEPRKPCWRQAHTSEQWPITKESCCTNIHTVKEIEFKCKRGMK